MKLRSKIYIDKLIGVPSVFLLNLLMSFFLLFKHEKEPDNSKIKRIAVCKFMGMGSIIQGTPLLRTLKNNFPEAELVFVTIPKNRSLLDGFWFIDNIQTVDDSSLIKLLCSSFKTLTWFLSNRPDVFIDMEIYSYFSTIFTVLSFSKFKIGFYRKESRIQLGTYSRMVYFNTKAPVKNIYLQVAELLNCSAQYKDLYDYKELLNDPGFHSSNVDSILPAGKEYIVINPNASDLRIERRWSGENYVSLIENILETYPDRLIVLTGSADETGYVKTIVDGIAGHLKQRVIDSSGKLNLKELIILINGCIMMITNDSGPMHLAFALKKKTIALFGPCSPVEYAGQQNVHFVYKNIYCSPCVHHFSISPCNGDNQCMKLVRVSEVTNLVVNSFEGENIWNNFNADGIVYKNIPENVPFGIVKRRD